MYSLNDDFVDSHGLVNSRPDEENGENSFLWTVELFFLMKERGLDTQQIMATLNRAVSNMKVSKGIYKQNPAYPHPKDDTTHEAYMSHDQLTAILSYCSATKDQKTVEEVTDVILSQKLIIYDNKDPDNPSIDRVIHPRDLGYYYILSSKVSKKVLGLLLYPILLGATIWTFATDKKCRNGVCFQKTDGELLYFVKRSANKKLFSAVNWFCDLMIKKRFGSWSKVWSTYFKDENHPIRKLVDEQ